MGRCERVADHEIGTEDATYLGIITKQGDKLLQMESLPNLQENKSRALRADCVTYQAIVSIQYALHFVLSLLN